MKIAMQALAAADRTAARAYAACVRLYIAGRVARARYRAGKETSARSRRLARLFLWLLRVGGPLAAAFPRSLPLPPVLQRM